MTTVKSVICYHQNDERHLRLLDAHLAPLCREKLLDVWHRGHLRPGDECDSVVAQKLESANLILLLVSADFNMTYDAALLDTIRRSSDFTQRIIPVPLRPCVWTGHPFFGLQPVPADGAPLIVNGMPDEARFQLTAVEIRAVAAEMRDILSALDVRSANEEATFPTPPGMMEALAASQKEIHGLEKTLLALEETLQISIEAVKGKVSYRPAFMTSLINAEREQQHRSSHEPVAAENSQNSSINRLQSALASAAQLDLDSCAPGELIDCASEFIERLFHLTRPGCLARWEVSPVADSPSEAST